MKTLTWSFVKSLSQMSIVLSRFNNVKTSSDDKKRGMIPPRFANLENYFALKDYLASAIKFSSVLFFSL